MRFPGLMSRLPGHVVQMRVTTEPCCCTTCMSCASADFGDRPTDDLPEEALKEMKQAKGTVYRMNDKPWWCAAAQLVVHLTTPRELDAGLLDASPA